MVRKVILVNEKDKFLGYELIDTAHHGEGIHHRAFVTLLFDPNKKAILQKRKHKLFDGFWDLTAISHPLRTNGKDESYQQASDRALKKEMGIGHVPVKKVGAFNYFAKDGDNCENEYCAVLVGKYNGKIKPNKKEVYETKMVDAEEFYKDVKDSPDTYTPWARLAVKFLKKSVV